MPQLIYVIEDDESIRELIRIALESYAYQVRAFETAEEALARIVEERPDLAIFDIMLPGMDGVEAVKQLRQLPGVGHTPVLFLTARDTELDKVTGLDSGGDDYMTKPFGILELCARIRSLLRRAALPTETEKPQRWSMGGLTLDAGTREVTLHGKLLELTFKEFELLQFLMASAPRVATREELLNSIWGYDYIGETRTLDIHIRYLRQKLGEDGSAYIKTVRGVGYRFCAPAGEEAR
ncbi:MAG: response regulator transcription factor [Eubacteriales bacterium]|jgi:two-component system alkaline phosphatase synthesis response regulator PhoP